MVGYVGTTELAASAFTNSIFLIGMVIVMGFTFGITPIVGQSVAKNNKIILSKILTIAFFINIIFAIFISIALYLLSFFFTNMGQESRVVSLSIPYFFTLVLSIIPLIIFYTLKQFAEGIGNTKHAMYITILSNILNIILNYILIFGKLGFSEYGLFGAGIATLSSRIFMALGFLLIFYYNKEYRLYFKRIKIYYINKVYITKLFIVGIPISMQILLEVLAFALTAIMAGWLGVIPLAAHQIAIGLASMSFMIVVGVGSATTIRVSHQLSHKDYKGLIMASKASIHIILTFMGLTSIIFFIFRSWLPILYTNDQAVILLASKLLIAAAIFQLFDGLQIVMVSILRGFSDVKHAMIYAFIAYIIINLPLGYYLSFKLNLGIYGLWIGIIVGLVSASLLFYWRFRELFQELKNK
jgi:MATE family multidrug resistance protein